MSQELGNRARELQGTGGNLGRCDARAPATQRGLSFSVFFPTARASSTVTPCKFSSFKTVKCRKAGSSLACSCWRAQTASQEILPQSRRCCTVQAAEHAPGSRGRRGTRASDAEAE